jgi:hypothetical protein
MVGRYNTAEKSAACFYPKTGGKKFLRNIYISSQNCMASQARRKQANRNILLMYPEYNLLKYISSECYCRRRYIFAVFAY